MKIPDDIIVATMQGVIDNFLIPRFQDLNMSATGQWLRSLEARAVNGNGEIWGMDYTYWLANGRRPGKMPPITPLISWVNAKFGIGGNEAKSVAFAVATKIKNEGTSYFPNGTDLLEILDSQEVRRFVIETIETFLTVEINKALIKQLHDNFSHS